LLACRGDEVQQKYIRSWENPINAGSEKN